MNKIHLTILIRYISLFMITINTLSYPGVFSNFVTLLLFLIIINNQFRFFNLKNKYIFTLISLCLEIFLSLILCKYIKNFNLFYFVSIVFDICFLSESYLKYIILLITLLSSFYTDLNISIYSALQSLFTLSIFSLLSLYIKQEDIHKINYQNTYDQLRISEDKLKKANLDLEIYVSSVEEIAILKERNRISREIHDSVGHTLSTTIIQLGAIENLLKNNAPLYSLVHELRDFVKDSFQEVRNAVSSLKPVEYENYQNLFKIQELIKNFIKLTDVDVKMIISKNTWNLSSTQSMTLYRIIQESLSNSLRHGNASKINIFIVFNKSNLLLTIKDNGVGCRNIYKGNGLNSIYERVNELNGKVEFINCCDGFSTKASFPKKIGGEFIE